MRSRGSARHEDPQRPALLATPAARDGDSSLPALAKPTTHAGHTSLPTSTLVPLASLAFTGQRAISSPALTSPGSGREEASRARRCDSRAGSTTGGSDDSGNAAVGALLTGAASPSTRGARAEGAEALSARAVAASGQEGLQPNLAAAMEQAMKPLMEQLQDNGCKVQKLIQTFGETTRRLEDRLQEERTHADHRFRQHEERLRKQAESQLSQHLEAVQQLQWKAQQQPPAGATSSREHGSSVMRQDTPTEAAHARLQGSKERSGGTTPELMAEGDVEPDMTNTPGWLQPAQAQDQHKQHEQLAEGPELGSALPSPALPRGSRASSQDWKFGRTTSSMPEEEDQFAKSRKSSRLDRMCSFKPAESKTGFLENRPTFCGFEYEEVKHYQRTSGTLMQRQFFALLLRWMDLLYSLQEPERKGCLAKVIRSKWFETLSATIIMANAGFMVYTVNDRIEKLSGYDSEGALIGETFFLSAYTLEITLKLLVHKLYFFVNADMQWNVFDLLLVALAISDQLFTLMVVSESQPIVLRSMRVLKLAKILRVMRIMRVFSDLRLMLSSVIGSCISLVWSFSMLAFIYYLFGLTFVQTLTLWILEDDPPSTAKDEVLEHFGSVLQAMLSLYKATTSGNDWDYYYVVIEPAGWTMCLLYVFFVGFVQISLMNILTAVFVERAMRLAQPDTLQQAREQRAKERAEAEELRRMCLDMDANQSGTVSAEEFREVIASSEMRCYFSVLGLDIKNAQEFFEMLADISENQEVEIDQFVQGCMRMRGAASGIAQQGLIMETRLLRKSHEQLLKKLTRRLDIIAALLPPAQAPTRALPPAPALPAQPPAS